MSHFHYVYILVDEATGTHFYIGCTEDLKSRLEKHNKGDVPHTAKFRPWRIKNAIAFDVFVPYIPRRRFVSGGWYD